MMQFRSPIETLAFQAMMEGRVYCDLFTYSCTYNTLAANAVGSVQTISINSDSDFVIQQINLAAFSAANTVVANPDYLMLLTDSGSGRQLMDAACHVATITGQCRDSGATPYDLPMAKLIRGGSVVSVALTNSGGVAAIVNVSLVGFKVFYNGTTSRQSIFAIN